MDSPEPGFVCLCVRVACVTWQDSESTYLMYATGRRLCRSCLVTLQLRKRHDVFWSLYDLVSPSDDTITLDVVLEDGSMDPFVMAVTRKRDYRALLSQVWPAGLKRDVM